MLAQHGLNISNYPTLQPQDVHLREGDVLYVLNPTPGILRQYNNSLPDIPGKTDFEVIRYVWRGEDTGKRREIDEELFPYDDLRRELDRVRKEVKPPKKIVQVEKKTVYIPAGRIDLQKILNGKGLNKVFFTSDTHFSDPRLLYHRRKFFSSLEAMDKALIDNWNAIVPPDGVVFHLGDFGYGKNLLEIAKALNGAKYIIGGNHDLPGTFGSEEMQQEGQCIPIGREQILYASGRRFLLCHYPYLCYEGEYSGTIQLFGHIHSGNEEDVGFDYPRLQYLLPYQYDVGVDNNNFRPISLLEILEKFPHIPGPKIERGEMGPEKIDEVQAIFVGIMKEEVCDGKPALWMERVFSADTIKHDIDQGYAHSLCIKGEVVGYFAIVPAEKVPDVPVKWKESGEPCCYIQRILRIPGFNGGVGECLIEAHRFHKDIRLLVPEKSAHLQSRLIQHLFVCAGTYTLEDGTVMKAYQRIFE